MQLHAVRRREGGLRPRGAGRHVGGGGGGGQRRDGGKGDGGGEPESHVRSNAHRRRSLWKGFGREPGSVVTAGARGGWRARGGAVVARPSVGLPVQPAVLGPGPASADHARTAARGARAAAGRAVLEIGPGTGYYTLPVAHRVGATGRLHVFDLQQEMLDHTMRRAARARASTTSALPSGTRASCRIRRDLRRRLSRHRARRDPGPGSCPAPGPARAAAGRPARGRRAVRRPAHGHRALASAPWRGGRAAIRAAGRLATRLLRGAAGVKSVGCRP